jgi:serine/threonine protein kinase
MTIPPGAKLGRYRVISELGSGGMGVVYLVHDEALGRSAALKVFSAEGPHKPHELHRFIQEARTAALIRHPNIAHIYEIGEDDGNNFIAMEYVEGVMLRHYKPTSLTEMLDCFIQIVKALVAAHTVGVVHRDLKPENIMVGTDGYIKILDFGLAKRIPRSERHSENHASTLSTVYTDPGTIIGTATYMSPEQARGIAVDARTDVWSVGVTMYEMLAGRPPFEANTVSDVISMILHKEPAPIARFSREVPAQLEWLVMKTLNKDPAERYQTTKELLADLQKLKRRFEIDKELGEVLSEFPATEHGRGGGSKGELGSLVSTESAVPRSTVPMSSVEYIVSAITAHKRGATITVAIFLLVAAICVAFYLSTRLPKNTSVAVSRTLSRLTSGDGLQSGAAWSPDGRFIAYSSDREGSFDIWVQPVNGGDPVRVTHSPAHDWQPDWSPDGNTIVFRSERENGGLFIIPAFGGREKRIASFGYRPRWSSDGKRVLCLSAGDEVYTHPELYVIGLDNQPPLKVSTVLGAQRHFAKQGWVAWHPDGQRISFLSDKGGFWTIPVWTGKPLKSELSPTVAKEWEEAGVTIGNFSWAPSGDALYFEGESKRVRNLWKVRVDPKTLAWISAPQRLTTGLGHDTEVALSKDGKRLAFTTVAQSTRIWSLPFDGTTGRIKGTGQPITGSDVDAWFPDLSPDGQKIVFVARRHGMEKEELWEKSLKDNSLRLLGADQYIRIIPRWSPDGKKLAYSRFLPSGSDSERPYVIAVLPAESGEEELVTSPVAARDYVYDWSPDGQWIAGSTNRLNKERWELVLFPLSAAPHAEKEMRIIASDPNNDLWGPRFSPDGRWISYLAQQLDDNTVSIINVIPASGGTATAITSKHVWSDKPRWSPDGKIIYFISNYDSMFLNVWGLHFDSAQGKPVGEPFRVTKFESPVQMIPTRVGHLEISLDQNRLFLPLTQLSGSIWILSDVDQ